MKHPASAPGVLLSVLAAKPKRGAEHERGGDADQSAGHERQMLVMNGR
jgi:hypothetical protein